MIIARRMVRGRTMLFWREADMHGERRNVRLRELEKTSTQRVGEVAFWAKSGMTRRHDLSGRLRDCAGIVWKSGKLATPLAH
jgi:hypothetical protein